MRRWSVMAAVAVLLAAPGAAEAHRLTIKEAKRITRQVAREDYYPARIYVQFCTRFSAHRVRCRFLAFYDEDYCSAYYMLRLRGDTVWASRPLLENCG